MNKKTLVIALAASLVAIGVQAQGTVSFANSAATRITLFESGDPAPTGTAVGLYWGTSSDEAGLALGPTANLIAPGIFVAGTRAIAGAPENSMIWVQVRAWSGAFDNYEDAFNSGDPSVLEGKSNIFQVPTGGGVNPPGVLTGTGRLEAFTVQPVPEPSTIALGLLGLAGLLAIRRRK